MRQSLSSGGPAGEPTRDPLPLHALTGWCCQAAGGQPAWAESAAAAWMLLYASAHLFDSVQDGDPPDRWWRSLGSGAAINVACGLLSSAWAVLAEIRSAWGRSVQQDFARTVLQMGSGQHQDLTVQQPRLDAAWAIAEAKSGAFFALACRSGARIAGADPATIQRYGEYGTNLGLMIQLADDAADLRAAPESNQLPVLPVAYCLETAAWRQPRGPGSDRQLQRMLSNDSTSLYLMTKLALFRARGIEALRAAAARPPAATELEQLLIRLDPCL